jgi:flavin reductase (DIM6/NTAB) family NADH-FMN oxidoreductase RutF
MAANLVTPDRHAEPFDGGLLRRAFGRVPSGVAAVCGLDADGTPVGMAVSTFTPVSLSPPLVSICVQNGSATWPRLRAAGALGVSVLAEGQHRLAAQLAAKDADRFAEVEWTASARGAVDLTGAAAWLETTLHAELPAGDHLIALLEVRSLYVTPQLEPLVFHGSEYRRLRGATASAGKGTTA